MTYHAIHFPSLDGKIYEGLNQLITPVGTIDPVNIDFELALQFKKPKNPGIRECVLLTQEEIVGELPKNDNWEWYFSDTWWHHCNYHCDYCFSLSPERTKAKFPYVFPDKRIAFLNYFSKNVNGYFYRIFGGEPILYPGFEEIITFLDQDDNCRKWNISTNVCSFKKISWLVENAKSKKYWLNIGVHPQETKFSLKTFLEVIRLLLACGVPFSLIGVDRHVDLLNKVNDDLMTEFNIRIPVYAECKKPDR